MTGGGTVSDLEAAVLNHPVLSVVLHRWDHINLPDAWLVAGAVAQAYLNWKYDLPPNHGLNDLDLIYYDGDDLDKTSEIKVETRIRSLFSDLPLPIDVKNQARVHLWYEEKFGRPNIPFQSAAHGIASFQATIHAVGVRPMGDGIEICAPVGLEDLLSGVIRPLNIDSVSPENYLAKAGKWRERWPQLRIIPRED